MRPVSPPTEEPPRRGQRLLPPGSAGRARLDEQASFIDFVNKEIPAVIARWEEYRAGGG